MWIVVCLYISPVMNWCPAFSHLGEAPTPRTMTDNGWVFQHVPYVTLIPRVNGWMIVNAAPWKGPIIYRVRLKTIKNRGFFYYPKSKFCMCGCHIWFLKPHLSLCTMLQWNHNTWQTQLSKCYIWPQESWVCFENWAQKAMTAPPASNTISMTIKALF